MKAKEKYYAALVKTVKAMLLVAFVVGIAIVLPFLSSGKSKTGPGSSKEMTVKAAEVCFSEKSQAVAEPDSEFGYPAPVDAAQDINPVAELPAVKDNNADTKGIAAPLRIVRIPERTTETEAGRDVELLPKQLAEETEITVPLKIPPFFTDELIAKLPARPELELVAELPLIKDAAELNAEDEKDNTSLRNTTTNPTAIGHFGGLPLQPAKKHKDADIYSAAYQNDFGRVKELLRANPELVNTKDRNSNAPLFYALNGKGNVEPMVKLLIANGADVNAREGSDSHNTPLISAAASGYVSIVKLLIANGADVNGKNGSGGTPLHAVEGSFFTRGDDDERLSIANFLIANGADVNAKSDSGFTPLQSAASKGDNLIAQLLIDNGADVNVKENWFLTGGTTALGHALIQNQLSTAQLLIDNGADVNVRTRTGNTLLPGGDDERSETRREFLIANGFDVNAKDEFGSVPLHIYATYGQENIVQFLITNGADVNAKNEVGFTPLYSAVTHDQLSMAELLIANGADVNAKDGIHSETPLYYVLLKGKESLAQLLIANGADVNARDSRDRTPLHLMTINGRETETQLLIANGADVNAEDKEGYTPLHKAVIRGDKAIVEILLANSANVNVSTNHGQTPLSIAVKGGNKEIAELLRAYGAGE